MGWFRILSLAFIRKETVSPPNSQITCDPVPFLTLCIASIYLFTFPSYYYDNLNKRILAYSYDLRSTSWFKVEIIRQNSFWLSGKIQASYPSLISYWPEDNIFHRFQDIIPIPNSSGTMSISWQKLGKLFSHILANYIIKFIRRIAYQYQVLCYLRRPDNRWILTNVFPTTGSTRHIFQCTKSPGQWSSR